MAAIGQRYYTPDPFEVDRNGVPYAAARLFFFLTGTSTPLDTWSDVNLTTSNTNPVVADANGRFGNIWLSPSQAYKVQFWSPATDDDPVGAQIWSADPVGPAAGGAVSNIAGIIGEVRTFAGPASAIPSQWLLCAGQAIDRTVYAALFSVIGTTYGAGDLSTTFNLPDCRGRASFGKDDMGGTPASRLTAGVSGVAGATLGASGGSQLAQRDTLTSSSTSTSTFTGAAMTASFPLQGNGGGASDGRATSIGGATVADGTTNSFTPAGTVATATSTTTTSGLTGSSQNVPPAIVFNVIIYAGA